MLKHMHIFVHLQHVLSWYTILEALESFKDQLPAYLGGQAQVD
jgi:hypothetical protein